MPDPLARHAGVCGDLPALSTPSGEWTYAGLNEEVRAVCGRLQSVGIGPGDRVGVHLPRSAETVVLFWALWRRGAVVVPLSTRLPPSEVEGRAERVACTVLFTGDSSVADAAPASLSVRSPDSVFEGNQFSSASREQSKDRPATILFTSGSTGTSKAALHTWANHLYSAKGSNANIPVRRRDRWVLSLSLYHVGGLAILLRCALVGATVVIPAADGSLADTLRRRRATHISCVSTQFRRILRDDVGPPPSLRAVLLGGGPIPEGLLRKGHERGWPLYTSYGCTEMASQVTTTAPGAPLEDLYTAGRALPHRKIRVDDGQILVAGSPLFRGYLTPEGLKDPRTKNGWYPTGDRGRIDAGGRLQVLGRMDRMFVSGGENIQPEEIETALQRLDGVEQAVVVPVPDAEFGRRPVAFVRGSRAHSPEFLRTCLSDTLAGYKIPEAFYLLPDDPIENEGKLDRDHLKNRARKLQK